MIVVSVIGLVAPTSSVILVISAGMIIPVRKAEKRETKTQGLLGAEHLK